MPPSDWDAFVEREPYFAVLTSPKYLRANLTPAHEREFFATGEVHVAWTLRSIEEHFDQHFAPLTTLEYGCGVGRLAIPFARRPGSVTAVDRSPAMLRAARQEAERCGVAHIAFQTPDELWVSGRQFDLVNCYQVLQRLAEPEGLALLRQLMARIGPGGIGVFHFPYQSTAPRFVRSLRSLRAYVPAANAVLNVARGRPAREPFIPTHTYSLNSVLGAFTEFPVKTAHVAFEEQPGFAAAICFVRMPSRETDAPREREGDTPIQVRQIIDNASLEELNRRADEYFSSLAEWEHHLTKPFSNVDETPTLLTNVATLLQGLRLTPGTTVLDFGAGSGWLSRFLTQLGCRVVVLDVSESALRIARKLYESAPVVGERPQPQFLLFDGRRIDLPDASVERIVCFDAFHHVSNPGEVVREFARVLKPGGIVGFAEPGPRHSQTPVSQFEMRAYGVVENDIDVHGIWRAARACGFDDLQMSVFHGSRFHVSLEQYEDLLAGGGPAARWMESTRGFLRHVRHFFLFKEGRERLDSRQADGLACEVAASLTSPQPASARDPLEIDAVVTNSGTAAWLPSDAPHGGVMLGVHLYDGSGKLLNLNAHMEPLPSPPREVEPGERVQLRFALPPLPPGRYVLEVDCIASGVTWFAQTGSRPAVLRVAVVP